MINHKRLHGCVSRTAVRITPSARGRGRGCGRLKRDTHQHAARVPDSAPTPDAGSVARSAEYWRRQLTQSPPVHGLPLDRPRRRAELTCAAVPSRIDAAISRAFTHLCESQSASLLAGLHAAFALLVARHSGERNIALGVPVAGALGTAVVRSDVAEAVTFRQLLTESCARLDQARTHTALSLRDLIQALELQPSDSYSPLFQLMVLVCAGRREQAAVIPPQMELILAATPTAEGIALEWRYAPELFDAQTITRWAQHFAVLLDAIATRPDEDVWRLPILDAAECRCVLLEWNDTDAAFADECLHQLFSAQTARTPQAIAVSCGHAQLCYAELNAKANRLAHYLRAQGVTAQSLVGVCLERSLDMVVGLLAILKAGGAYVPLDRQYPRERLAFMLADSGAAWVLTDAHTRTGLGDGVAQIALDDASLQQALQSFPSSDPAPLPGHGSNALAYLIYTSGSTGVPKGVCIEHRHAAALIAWAQSVYDASMLSGVLAATSICFDLSVFEIFVPLCSGGRVVLVKHALDIEGIRNARGVTLINTVPSAIKVLVEERLVPASVRVVNLAGEALSGTLVREIYEHTSTQAVFNLYGPSEDTTYSTYALIERGSEAPPIGKPIANGRVYVLDAHLQPLPVGVLGEIYVGGAGVARGYWNQPQLTAERFIADPFRDAPGARLYKTGDLGRWSVRGELEFAGRIDHQIKLRGFRIEPDEIQAQLLALAEIGDALVMVREDAHCEKQLVAYVTRADGTPATRQLAQYCRSQLQARLPDYMIPAAFVVLERLPLTPNGKVDRRALPVPQFDAYGGGEYEAPQGEREETLAGLWQALLRVERVGRQDNFFELGGHSLLAMRVLSTVRQQYQVAVPLRVFFEAPTIRELARMIGESSAAQLPLLDRGSRAGVLPLSPAQQRLWFIDQLEGGSAHYHLPLRFALAGELDEDALRRALQGVLDRHESLRTVVAVHEYQPTQRIVEGVAVPFEAIDLSGMCEAEQAAEVEHIATAQALQPFALDRGPMLRAKLLQLAVGRHELLLIVHHIAADGWSLEVLKGEISALYRAALAGEAAQLPALPVQYADYALWQQQWQHSEWWAAQSRYWMGELSNLPTLHHLPLDRPRPVQQSLAGASHRSWVDAATLQAFTRLCREQQATLFMGLHAVFSALLARHSGEHDIVVGTPIANREQAELAALIGFFVNTLVLRCEVGREASFVELLRRCRRTALAAYTHQQLPFEQLVDRLQPERSLSHTPLFQIALALQNTEHVALELCGVQVLERPVESIFAPFELTLDARQTAEGLQLDWVYRRELFDAASIERLAEHLTNLMRAIIAQPESNVWELDLLGEAQRGQLVVEWSAAQLASERCVHELFEAQVQRAPEAIAVASESGQISYAELSRRANRCAHYLRARGVGPDSIVAVLMDRSIEMVVAMLGVMKAGGAYLPLDASYPQARLEYMLSDARVQVVLTQRALAARLRVLSCVCMDEPGVFDAYPPTPPAVDEVAVKATNLAYLIYTSGSTGEPKGVMNTHAGLANLCRWHTDAFGTDAHSRCTLLASIGFDAAVWELWSTLLSGACAVSVSDTVRATPHLFAALLCEQRITHCFVPTGLIEAMSTADVFASKHLRVVLCGGDKLQRHCLPAQSQARLVNCYGPTEAAVVSTSYEMPRAGAALIGKPITNVQAYVLNDALQLQPIGVIGELYIGGAGLARGYLNAAELTRAHFIRDPFSADASARLYRTGDYVRMLADGNLEFIGRRDQQVKLRGFRIELGEIESRLNRHPLVQAAVVVLREDAAGQKRLVGYLVPRGLQAQQEIVAAVEAALRQQLPEHMVPSALIVLDELPLTANGKLDRARLPMPPAANDENGAAPATPTETALAAIWSQLLERSEISTDVNFFAAGGHSLLITQMIHLIAARLQVRATTKDVFLHPTIRALAAVLDGRGSMAERRPAHDRGGGATPLSLCQFRVWYVEQMRGETNEHNMPAVMTLRGAVDPVLLERALNSVIARHEMLRTRFALEQGMPVQFVEPVLAVNLETHDVSLLPPARASERVRELTEQHATRVFNIQRLPLLTVMLVRIAAAEYRLQLNFHHLIFDGCSFALFCNELIEAYESCVAGAALQLPPTQGYASFVHWQQQWLQSPEAQAQAQFWREYLHDCSGQFSLPGQVGSAKAASTQGKGAHATVHLTASTRRALALLACDRQATVFNVLYSAFALLLARLSGQDDFNIGIPVNGRHVREAQGVIGNFVNNLPVRNRIRLQQRFDEYLDEQVGNLRQVLSNQDYPFEKILELSPRSRRRDATPLFQVFFNMFSLPPAVPPRLFTIEHEDGVDIEPKFDLTLYVDDSAEGVELVCHYNVVLFAPGAIQHVLHQYVWLLEHVAQNAQLPCGDYSLQTATGQDRRDLEPQRYWPGSVQDIFRRRALQQPDALAIIEHDQQWTYDEVLRASLRLAQSLQQRGVGPGDVVGIVAARRACMVVGVLATLQTGAAFCLLNPEYPVERVCLLVSIVQPACVLFAGEQSTFARALTATLHAMAVCEYLPAAKMATDAGEVIDFVPVPVEPEQLACVTFTSGTTGIPKAVAGVHIGISGYLAWVPKWLEISPADRFSMLSGLGHDPIQRDMFGPLCSGATLVIPQPEVIAPRLLAQWLKRHAITFVHMTPAMAQVLCATEETSFPSLRVTFLTGEKLHGDAVTSLLRYNPAMRILNSYGTTETQRAVTYFEASKMRDHHGVVPIGESAPDAVIRVLNGDGTPCGMREVGDIFIESHALSMGYRNDAELTAKVLTHLPDGSRRYRTGDVGCRLPDGTVLVLGRKDGQINLRGFRIEPGEIEAQLRSLDAIKDAVVLLAKREAGEPALVAYAVPVTYRPEDRAVRTAVFEHLKATLPAYMVPAAVLLLEQFPLTPNGKLDRSALPAPVWHDGAQYMAPATELERTLAAIWAEVLQVERVGVLDDFFALGGHSMLMVLLLTHLRRRLDMPFQASRILGCTTIREQVQVLEGRSA